MSLFGNKNNIKEQSMGKGFVILSVSNILVRCMSLLFVPACIMLLGGESEYSIYYSANQVFSFVYVLTTAGLPVAISKIVTEMTSTNNRAQAKQAFRICRDIMLIIGLVFGFLMMIYSKQIAVLMNNEDCWMGVLFLGPTVFVCSLLSAYRGYLQGMKNMTPTAISQVVEQIVHVVVALILILVLRGKGIVWAVAGGSIGTLAGAVVALLIVYKYYLSYKNNEDSYLLSHNEIPKEKLPTKTLLLRILFYSLPITLNSGIQYGGNLIDTSVLKGRLMAGGFMEVDARSLHGMMGATRQILNVPNSLVSSLCISLLPVIAGLYAAKKLNEAKNKANYAFRLCYTLAVPISVAMCVFAEPMYTVLGLGDGYRLLSYMSFSVLLMAIVHLQSSVMQSVNQLFTSMFFMAIGVATKLILNYFLIAIPSVNIYGAIIATYISYIIPLLLNHIFLIKKRNIKIKLLRLLIAPALSSGVMITGATLVYVLFDFLCDKVFGNYLTSLISLLFAATCGVVVYFVTLYKLHGIDEDDIALVIPKRIRDTFKRKNKRNA